MNAENADSVGPVGCELPDGERIDLGRLSDAQIDVWYVAQLAAAMVNSVSAGVDRHEALLFDAITRAQEIVVYELGGGNIAAGMQRVWDGIERMLGTAGLGAVVAAIDDEEAGHRDG